MQNNMRNLRKGFWKRFQESTPVLLLMVLSGVILRVPMSAQSLRTENAITGSISGTVVDASDDPIPGATVVVQAPSGERSTAVTKDDGAFVFNGAPASAVCQITVTAEGFADWNSSITVEPGQNKTLPQIKLRILAVQRAVTVI